MKNITIKFVKITTIIATIIISLDVNAENYTNLKSDEEIHALMIGSWVIDPKDPSYDESGGAISTYESNGVVIFQAFNDITCKVLSFEAQGNWKIQHGLLITTVTSSTRPDILPPGLVVVDIVSEINQKSSILVSEDIEKQYRFRSDKCIVKENL